MKITFINEFHGTTATVIAKGTRNRYYISASAYKRAINKLCGVKGCMCGGIRGGRYNVGEETGDGFFRITCEGVAL